MDGPRDYHDWSKLDREIQIYHLHVGSKRMVHTAIFKMDNQQGPTV